MERIKYETIDTYFDYNILREEYKVYNDDTGKYSGKAKVFYTVYDDEWTLESFKTLKEARKFIETIL